MARRDGREAAQLREMNCELAVLERADGSARFHQGKTRVLAAIFGRDARAYVAGGRSRKDGGVHRRTEEERR
jgi:ribonuclease PH